VPGVSEATRGAQCDDGEGETWGPNGGWRDFAAAAVDHHHEDPGDRPWTPIPRQASATERGLIPLQLRRRV
jgi:hypothetical protein